MSGVLSEQLEQENEERRGENQMQKVSPLKVYIEEVRAFIAKQKTRRAHRELREINALTGPNLIKGKTEMIEIGRREAGMEDRKRSVLGRSEKERVRKIRKERRSDSKENKTTYANCRHNQSRGS